MERPPRFRTLRSLVLVGLTALLVACGTLGPKSIPRDQFDYTLAVADAWKRQMLLNIVKLRYAEPPVFMEVASLISQYEMASTVNVGSSFNGGFLGDDVYNLGANARYADRPTITYNPLTGQEFARSLLTPIPPGSLMRLVQAGYPIDFIFTLGVRAINGVRNRSGKGLLHQGGDPAFLQALHLLGEIQRADAVGMRVQKGEQGADTVLFFRGAVAPAIEQQIRQVRELLRLDQDQQEFQLAFGVLPRSNDEIAILSRSMLEILIELALEIEAPQVHIDEGSTIPNSTLPPEARLLRIYSQAQRPHDAFAAVPYRGYWYWIDHKDMLSKRAMTFLMVLFSLAETGDPAQVPVVTVGAGS